MTLSEKSGADGLDSAAPHRAHVHAGEFEASQVEGMGMPIPSPAARADEKLLPANAKGRRRCAKNADGHIESMPSIPAAPAVLPGQSIPGQFPRAWVPAVTPEEAPDEWPVPEALQTPSVPPFPLEVLGEWHRRFVEDLCEEVQAAVDGPATMSLAVLSGACANSHAVRAERPFPVHLWALWVADTGEGKTPVIGRCLRPLTRIQEKLADDHASAALDRAVELEVEQRLRSHAARLAAKAESDEEKAAAKKELRSIAERITRLRASPPPRVTTTDATPAGLVRRLRQPGERLIVATEEASEIFFGIVRRSRRNQEDIQAMLQAYSGARIEHDRGNGSVYIDRPALTIVGAIQPDAFGQALRVTSFHDQGLLARFLVTKPSTRTAARRPPRPCLSTDTEYDRRVAALWREDPSGPPRTLRLSGAATSLLDEFAREIDDRCCDGADLHACRGWAGKLRENVIRLAAVLALADTPGTTMIEAPVMERAQTLGRYFLAHAVAIFRIGTELLDDQNAEIVLQWIRARRQDTFEHHRAVRSHGGRLNGEEVDDALDLLVRRGYLRRVLDAGRGVGRPRSPTYRVHPRVLQRRN